MQELHASSEELIGYITLLERAIIQMTKSMKVARYLEVVLAFSNHMNNSLVRGVSFATILALTQSKARDNKTTMLVFLCKLLQEKGEGSVLELDSELSEVPAAANVSQQRIWALWGGIKKGRRNFEKERQQLRQEEMQRYYLGQQTVEHKLMAEADLRSTQRSSKAASAAEEQATERTPADVNPSVSDGVNGGATRSNLLSAIQAGRGGRGRGGRTKGRGAMLAAIQGAQGKKRSKARFNNNSSKDVNVNQPADEQLQQFLPSRMLEGFISFAPSADSRFGILESRVKAFEALLHRLQLFFALGSLADTEQVLVTFIIIYGCKSFLHFVSSRFSQ